jgi:hypothetical protein
MRRLWFVFFLALAAISTTLVGCSSEMSQNAAESQSQAELEEEMAETGGEIEPDEPDEE